MIYATLEQALIEFAVGKGGTVSDRSYRLAHEDAPDFERVLTWPGGAATYHQFYVKSANFEDEEELTDAAFETFLSGASPAAAMGAECAYLVFGSAASRLPPPDAAVRFGDRTGQDYFSIQVDPDQIPDDLEEGLAIYFSGRPLGEQTSDRIREFYEGRIGPLSEARAGDEELWLLFGGHFEYSVSAFVRALRTLDELARHLEPIADTTSR